MDSAGQRGQTEQSHLSTRSLLCGLLVHTNVLVVLRTGQEAQQAGQRGESWWWWLQLCLSFESGVMRARMLRLMVWHALQEPDETTRLLATSDALFP